MCVCCPSIASHDLELRSLGMGTETFISRHIEHQLHAESQLPPVQASSRAISAREARTAARVSFVICCVLGISVL